MRFEFGILAASVAILFADAATASPSVAIQTSPPIFHPGAPGQPSRVITPERALELGRTRFVPADVAFMQHMIVHHAQAVEMVELMETRASDRRVRLLGRRISLSQEAEMALMRDWLEERGQPIEMQAMDHAAMGHGAPAGHGQSADDTPVMAGMLTPRQMRTLAAASGTAFDRLFLQGMIQHHQGALDMVRDLLNTPDAAEDTLLSDFAASVVGDQQAEILRMQSLSAEL